MKTLLFDFDGTLVDSMPTFAAVMTRILDENGITYGEELVKIITPLGYHGTADYYISLGLQRTREELVETMTRYAVEAYATRIEAKENVIPALRALKAAGCSLNVLTASPHEMLDPCLRRLGIWELFDHVWSCDDFATTKSDPAIYRMAAERIGVPIGEMIFLDDNCNADRVAVEAGARVWGVFDASSAEYEDEIRSLTERYITDFSELPRLLSEEDEI